MSDEALPRSIGSETLTILGVHLVVHQLDDGRRIFEADGLAELFAQMGSVGFTEDEAMTLVKAAR